MKSIISVLLRVCFGATVEDECDLTGSGKEEGTGSLHRIRLASASVQARRFSAGENAKWVTNEKFVSGVCLLKWEARAQYCFKYLLE